MKPPPARPRRSARGGRGGSEPRTTIEWREREVVERRNKRHSQRQIADDLGISQAAVSKILRRVSRRWALEMKASLDQHRFEVVGVLGHHLREAMAGWERSYAPRVSKRQRKHPDGGVTSEVVIDESPGDPRFLQQVLSGLSQLAEVQGVDSERGKSKREELSDLRLEVEQAKPRLAAKINVLMQKLMEKRRSEQASEGRGEASERGT